MICFPLKVVFLVLLLQFVGCSIVVKDSKRTVDITSQLVKSSSVLTFQNNGKTAESSVLIVSDMEKGNLAHFGVKSGDLSLKVTDAVVSSRSDVKHFSVKLEKPLLPGKSVKLQVDQVVMGGLVPFPAEITQSEPQLVVYKGNHYTSSPYLVESQTTKFMLASSSVESYTKLKPSQLTDTTIMFGPYEGIAPYSNSELVIHSENNSPFLEVAQLHRNIEISHWGSISIEETLDVYHSGAKLQGSFSRFDFQREQKSGVSSIQNFKTSLPASATGVYYRDDIGNISTSNMRALADEVEVELRPRFPLFGGWKTHYTIGYNVPIYEYLYQSGSNYLLKMRLIDHLFNNMAVEKITVKVILPEGASNIELETPYAVDRHPDALFLTYLDITGRPVISFSKNNLVEDHIQDFRIGYTFPYWMTIREPLMVVFAFFLIFIVVIIYARMDFSISQDEVSASREKVAGVCEKVKNFHEARCMQYQKIEDAIAKTKSNKDVTSLQNSAKSATNVLKSDTQAIAGMIDQLHADCPADVAEKLAELQRHDKSLRELLGQHVSLTEKLIAGKLNKTQFVDQEGQLVKKKEDLVQKMEGISASI